MNPYLRNTEEAWNIFFNRERYRQLFKQQEFCEKMQDRIVNFVENNSKISAADFRSLMMKTGELVMDVGTVLDGEGAVECGLVDSLGGLCDALDYLNSVIESEAAQ